MTSVHQMSIATEHYTDPDGNPIPVECVGVSGPMKLEKASEQDEQSSAELEQTLKDMNLFETPAEVTQRKDALRALQELCNQWVRRIAREQNIPDHVARQYEGKVFTFGSYRIGINTRGADIDALLVVPRFIEREAFFADFEAILMENQHVEDLHAVPDAFVPVLKMKFYGVDIDLLFAKLDRQTIGTSLDLCRHTEEIFRNMDDRDVRSINGVRVTEEILRLVYDKETFKTSLRAIRMWARARGIYGNSQGYFGGVTWAILVARVCQLCPVAKANVIVSQFFMIYNYWPWPRPVMLKNTEEFSHLDFPVWDPRKNPSDQYHLLPIITPAFPAQNSTYNVTQSTKSVILKELALGKEVVSKIMLGERPWSALFEPVNFFTYKHYVIVIVTGIEKGAFLKLCGRVESRLRVLIMNFDNNERVSLAHLCNRSFGPIDGDEPSLIKKWVIGMLFQPSRVQTGRNCINNLESANEAATSSVDLSFDINNFVSSVNRGVEDECLSEFFTVKHARRKDLSRFIPKEELDSSRRLMRSARLEQLKMNDAAAASDSRSTGTPEDTSSVGDVASESQNKTTKRPLSHDKLNRVESVSSLSSNWAEIVGEAQEEEKKSRELSERNVLGMSADNDLPVNEMPPDNSLTSPSAKVLRMEVSDEDCTTLGNTPLPTNSEIPTSSSYANGNSLLSST